MGLRAHTTVTFKVRLSLPKGANIAEAQQMVKAAIVSYPGSLHSDDAMVDLDRESVTVSLMEKVTKYA